jgi:serine/threonine protein phosphatase PrpC
MHIVLDTIGGRPYMEDTYIIGEKFIQNMDLYCIFDGHGGDFVSNYLRDNYTHKLREALRENKGSIPDMMFSSIQDTIRAIPKDESMHCGSTYLIALKYGEIVYIANGGDCRAIMNVNDEAKEITVDHKPALQKEYDRIRGVGGFVTFTPGDAPRVDGILAVSRSIGDFSLYPKVTWVPDIYITHVTDNNHFLIMASDGLWDTMSNKDVNDIFISAIVQNNSVITKEVLEVAARECMTMAQRKGSQDNITILVATI